MAKGNFIRFFEGLFLNGRGVALYETGDASTVLACVETIDGDELGRAELRRDWLEDLPGNQAGRIANVIESICG